MKVTNILMKPDLVRASLDGLKTNTRRLRGLDHFNKAPDEWELASGEDWIGESPHPITSAPKGAIFRNLITGRLCSVPCPWGYAGDLVYVRENGWERPSRSARMMRQGADTWPPYVYDADGLSEDEIDQFRVWGWKRRPSIHMHRWASRLTLRLKDVRVERLQDISVADAIAEGIHIELHEWRDPEYPLPNVAYRSKAGAEWRYSNAREAFRELWESINGAGSWDANPWLWVLHYDAVAANVDQVLKEIKVAA